ncbi:MAG TPA: hypothetical protein DIT40_08895 [Alphaproteobacteria bacterium]|nr:hypothetical protein [Alphaproteobacteria bacterium]
MTHDDSRLLESLKHRADTGRMPDPSRRETMTTADAELIDAARYLVASVQEGFEAQTGVGCTRMGCAIAAWQEARA